MLEIFKRKSNFIILGAGGHARVLLDIIKLQQCNIIGLVDTDSNLIGKDINGIPVIGDDKIIVSYNKREVNLVNGIGGVFDTKKRAEIYFFFKKYGYSFARIFHPKAIISQDVIIGEGSQILAGAILAPGVKVGENCLINHLTCLDHDSTVDSNVIIAPGAVICGNVSIDEGAFIGAGSVCLQGITVGKNALIAAGSTVVSDVKPGKKVKGSPARPY